MGSDFERWKKRRDAERERREAEGARERGGGSRGESSRERAPYGMAPRYRGYTPPPRKSPRRNGNSIRGCLGCLGMVAGALTLLMIGLLVLGTFYWRQIEQRGQVNVMILGIDQRPTEDPPFRSDTMMLAGFSPRQKQVALVNVPRDLWVTIPDHGENRVNMAHFFGGPRLTKQTVRNNFGIPLHYYVTVNFDGFTSIIDAMGGITVDVPERLYDDNYPTEDYGVKTIEIPEGVQQMDGATALIYARSRYSTDDFDRSRRQQEIITAMRDRMLQPEAWLRAPEILMALSNAVETDIPSREWPALALIMLRSDIERTSIGYDNTRPHITSNGAYVLLPIWDQINPILAQYFE